MARESEELEPLEEPELVRTNTEHIRAVLRTVAKEQDMQSSPYGVLIWDLLYLVQILRGYSPDIKFTENDLHYVGHGTVALADTNPVGVQVLIAALALLPTGKAALEPFAPWTLSQPLSRPVVVCPECLREFDLLDPTDFEEWSWSHDCEAAE